MPDPSAQEPFEIVAIASSAGGVAALMRVLSQLPAALPVPIVVVQHLDPRHRSLMAEIMGRHSPLAVKEAEERDHLAPATVYFAPPDQHLLVNTDSTLTLTRTELVHFVRPSADLLFESVAAAYGARSIAVVLTGTGVDGAMGVKAIKKCRGTVIVQDQESSEFFGMPHAAITTGDVDFVLPLDEIAEAVRTLVMENR